MGIEETVDIDTVELLSSCTSSFPHWATSWAEEYLARFLVGSRWSESELDLKGPGAKGGAKAFLIGLVSVLHLRWKM